MHETNPAFDQEKKKKNSKIYFMVKKVSYLFDLYSCIKYWSYPQESNHKNEKEKQNKSQT